VGSDGCSEGRIVVQVRTRWQAFFSAGCGKLAPALCVRLRARDSPGSAGAPVVGMAFAILHRDQRGSRAAAGAAQRPQRAGLEHPLPPLAAPSGGTSEDVQEVRLPGDSAHLSLKAEQPPGGEAIRWGNWLRGLDLRNATPRGSPLRWTCFLHSHILAVVHTPCAPIQPRTLPTPPNPGQDLAPADCVAGTPRDTMAPSGTEAEVVVYA
jgi:hypothetical protein